MSSADFNNLALRKTVSYQPDGSFVTAGYVFTVGQQGRQNWTNSLALDGLTLSTLFLNSPLQVSTIITGRELVSSLEVSSLGVSTMIGSTVYASALRYGTMTGSTINASTLTTPAVSVSTVYASSVTTNSLQSDAASITALQTDALAVSSANAIAMITCTLAASTINFTVVNFAVSNVSTLTNNSLINTSTMTGSTMTLINLSTSALSVSTLQASTMAGSALALTSSLTTSSVQTGLLGFSTAVGASVTLQSMSGSTLQASTVNANTVRIAVGLTTSTMACSTLSTTYLAVQSTATISTLGATTINYTTILGTSMTANAAQVRSTLTVSTVNATNVSFTTLTGTTATMRAATVNSTLGVSTVNSFNTSFSTALGSSLTVLGGAIQDLKTSTIAGSTLSMNSMSVNSTLAVSSVGFTNAVGGSVITSHLGCSTLETSTVTMNAAVTSTLGVSTLGAGSVEFATMRGGVVTADLATVSTITGSTINFQNLGFSSLLISTITVNTAFPSLLGASTITTRTLAVSSLLTISSGGSVGIGTTAPVYPLSVAAGGMAGLEMNQTGVPLGSTMYAAGAVYSVTHPATGFRGEYAYAYGGASVLASAAESQAVGYFAVDVAQAGVFGTKAFGVPTAATMYVDNTKTTMVGALGVGTTSPSGMLAVAQDLAYAAMTLNPMEAQVVIGGKTNNGVVKIGTYSTGGAFATAMQSSYLVNGSDTAGVLMLNPLGGMVGIGISTAPTFALDIGLGSVQAGSLQIRGQNATPGYLRLSTANSINRLESGTLTVDGSAAPLYITNFGATATWMSVGETGLVGIGTTSAIAPLHVYGAAGVSLASSRVVNYTQTTALGFNFGGGNAGTRDSFQMTVAVVNRDGGAGPTYYDTGAQCDLVFKRKTNAYYLGNASDMTYTEVMRLGGATGLVGIGTTAGAGTLSVWGSAATSTVAAYWGSALADTAVDWETTATGGRRWRMGVASTASSVAAGGSLYWYDVTGSATRMVVTATGSVGIGITTPTAALHVVGNIYASGTITQGSDARFKAAIEPLENALEKIDTLRGYTYQRVDHRFVKEGEREMGLMAQEVQAVFPELVIHDRQSDRLRLNYSGMVAPLVEAVRTLKAHIEALQRNQAEKAVYAEQAAPRERRSAAGEEMRARLQAEMAEMRAAMAAEKAAMRAMIQEERENLRREQEEMRAFVAAMRQ